MNWKLYVKIIKEKSFKLKLVIIIIIYNNYTVVSTDNM